MNKWKELYLNESAILHDMLIKENRRISDSFNEKLDLRHKIGVLEGELQMIKEIHGDIKDVPNTKYIMFNGNVYRIAETTFTKAHDKLPELAISATIVDAKGDAIN